MVSATHKCRGEIRGRKNKNHPPPFARILSTRKTPPTRPRDGRFLPRFRFPVSSRFRFFRSFFAPSVALLSNVQTTTTRADKGCGGCFDTTPHNTLRKVPFFLVSRLKKIQNPFPFFPFSFCCRVQGFKGAQKRSVLKKNERKSLEKVAPLLFVLFCASEDDDDDEEEEEEKEKEKEKENTLRFSSISPLFE